MKLSSTIVDSDHYNPEWVLDSQVVVPIISELDIVKINTKENYMTLVRLTNVSWSILAPGIAAILAYLRLSRGDIHALPPRVPWS
jgi:hypothetical protein